MKKNFIFYTIILLLIASLSTSFVFAASDIQTKNANALVKLNIIKGYSDGSLGLDNKIKRSEFFTLVNRSFGYLEDSSLSSYKIDFTDISSDHWAYNNIKLAVKNKLVTGYPDKTIKPENNVTYAESLAVVIRALGYEKDLKGEWPQNVVTKAKELGLTKNVSTTDPNLKITRGEMSVIIYNTLTVNFK